MSEYFTGYYYIGQNDTILVLRKVNLELVGDKLTALHKAAQSDPIYLKLGDPEVGVIIEENIEASFLRGFKIIDGHACHPNIKVDGLTIGDSCSNCEGPLPNYIKTVNTGRHSCPHCGAVFITVKSHPFNDMACGIAMQEKKIDPLSGITAPFELPYGYPVPPIIHDYKDDAQFCLLTEKNNLDEHVGAYINTLR